MRDRLAPYRRKRDFAKTSEPRGGRSAGRGGTLRFVVQKHAARRLHYDFRLELDGVLKSWAVPKGPSNDPGVKRLAVAVEDHPLDYADFEGIIPEGEYGGGTVMVWDTGTWLPLGADPAADYRKGSLKFELHGKKLHGQWALVRMHARDGDRNWLLVKEHDDAARPGSGDELTERHGRSVLSGRSLAGIAKSRDRVWRSNRASAPASVDVGSIAGAKKAALPTKLAPQLATLVEAVPEGGDWLHEIKFDGYRMLARISGGKARLFSRNGKDWTGKFPRLAAVFGALPLRQGVIDGEIVHLLPNGVSSFGALKQDLAEESTDDLVFFAFDLLHLDGYSLIEARLDARKALLKELTEKAASPLLRFSEHVVGNGEGFHREACRLALEGIVSKRADSPYRAGRSALWVKMKCLMREELAIIGWTDPSGARQGFGSLLLGYYDPTGKLHFAGGVGTGFDQRMLAELRRRLDRLARKTPPSREIAALAPRRAHWVSPSLVAELRFGEWTADGRLRHASFLGLRDDKRGRDVVLDRKAKPVPAAASEITPRSTVEIAGIRLTHAGKLLYPADGIAKLDLAQYYATVADRMLAEAGGRPLTLVRCPDGQGGKCFFQKHANDTVPDALRRFKIAGDDAPYLAIEDASGLIALVQMGVLEIHLWGAQWRDVERPDRVTIDLDPDRGLDWSRMIEAAMTVRGLLSEMGLDSFAKATGGKGLHVVVPLAPRYGWDEVKAFSKSIAEELVRRAPDAYTASLAKKARRGRIFIDYLRNQRGASAIAAFSARARPGAPVAAPLAWKEVENGTRADAFTVITLPQRLAALTRDPWHDLHKLKQKLPAMLRRRLRAA